ncbi:MAG: type I addiction module toxin, SymE family [Firmicutes bacterium]|nr:type I addiction module toxin, SymE family [Bacillota bacterium]
MPTRPHRLTVSSIWSNNKRVPMIRLTGNWLAENGFQIGRKIIARITSGRLVVEVDGEEEE